MDTTERIQGYLREDMRTVANDTQSAMPAFGSERLSDADARSGKFLWRFQMGSALHGTSVITYMLDSRQQVLVPVGATLAAWALPDVPRVPSTR